MKQQVKEYLEQRLLINSNDDVFTKFDELVDVVTMLVIKEKCITAEVIEEVENWINNELKTSK